MCEEENSHASRYPPISWVSHTISWPPPPLGTWDSFLYSPFVALNIIWTGIWPPVHKASLGNSPVSQTHQESWTGKRLPNHISSIGKRSSRGNVMDSINYVRYDHNVRGGTKLWMMCIPPLKYGLIYTDNDDIFHFPQKLRLTPCTGGPKMVQI